MCQEPEQTEALPLVVSSPKKKRSKVTDTRLSPRAARALLHDGLRRPSIDSFTASSSVSPTQPTLLIIIVIYLLTDNRTNVDSVRHYIEQDKKGTSALTFAPRNMLNMAT